MSKKAQSPVNSGLQSEENNKNDNPIDAIEDEIREEELNINEKLQNPDALENSYDKNVTEFLDPERNNT